MSDTKPGPEIMALVDKHVDSDRVKQLHPGGWSEADQERASARWADLIAEAERLKDGNPASAEAQELARRWMAMVGQFTRGDARLTGQLNTLYAEAASDPATARQMPFSPEVSAFVKRAVEARRTHE